MTPNWSLETLLAFQTNAARIDHYVHRPRPTFIPILLTGGIGDVIMAIDSVRLLSSQFSTVIYTKHLETFKFFCPSVYAEKDIPDYDWHLEFNTVARFRLSDSFHGFLIKGFDDLFESQQEAFRITPILKALVKRHAELDSLLAMKARELGLSRRQFALYSLGMEDVIPDTMRVRSVYPENYITIHDGYDTSNWAQIVGRATKQWKLDHWNSLVQSLKKEYPTTKIIQLGAITGRPVDGVDECLLDKTSITGAFNILRKAKFHIDGDSGLVHAATRMGVPCVVLFGPTPDYFYGYPWNVNLRSNVCQEACFWVKKDWMNKCPIGYEGPKCMDEITPEQVMDAIMKSPTLF